jgi:hypothetical protein
MGGNWQLGEGSIEPPLERTGGASHNNHHDGVHLDYKTSYMIDQLPVTSPAANQQRHTSSSDGRLFSNLKPPKGRTRRESQERRPEARETIDYQTFRGQKPSSRTSDSQCYQRRQANSSRVAQPCRQRRPKLAKCRPIAPAASKGGASTECVAPTMVYYRSGSSFPGRVSPLLLVPEWLINCL